MDFAVRCLPLDGLTHLTIHQGCDFCGDRTFFSPPVCLTRHHDRKASGIIFMDLSSMRSPSRRATVEETVAAAREICRKHQHVIDAMKDATAPRDIALRIFLSEIAQERSPARRASHPRASADGVGSLGGDSSPKVELTNPAPTPNMKHMPQPSGEFSPGLRSPVSERSMEFGCRYCNEPSSRFCKETGRRHETREDRARRQWKQLFQLLYNTNRFLRATGRLRQENSCVEEFFIELT